MYNWRFLILAFLAALQPISSFSQLNIVDGRGHCGENEPTSLLRETRLLYRSHRLWKTSVNRLNLNRDITKNRRHEADVFVFQRSTGDRRVADRRSERDVREVYRVPFRLVRDDTKRAAIGDGDRRKRVFTTVERDDHRITSRDISRLERERVQDSDAISSRYNDERNRNSMDSRRESRNHDAHSEFRNIENRETRNLLQRARDDVVSRDRRDQQIRLSRSLERYEHGARDGMRSHYELIQNELKPNRERDYVRDRDQEITRSLGRRDQKIRGRTETRHELNQNKFRLNRERDSTRRIRRSLERRDHRATDRIETREQLSRNEIRLSRERDSTNKMSRSLERRDHRATDRIETREQNKIRLNREHDSTQRMSRSLERLDHRATDRMETCEQLSRNKIRLNRERDSTHRMSRSLERRDHRATDRMETREQLSRNEIRLNKERDSTHRMSRSLEGHDHRATDRIEMREQLIRNEIRLNRERDSTYRMGQSAERRDQRATDRIEMREQLNRKEIRLNRERDSTHRMSRSLERRDHRARDKTELRDEFRRSGVRLSRADYSQDDDVIRFSRKTITERVNSPRSRVSHNTYQIMVREKRSTEPSSSESRYQTRDRQHRQAAERLNERRALSSRQDTRVRAESRSDRRIMNDNDRLATREMENNRFQRSRSESRQMDQRLPGQDDRRKYERDVDETRFRSRSLLMDINKERQPVNHRERERDTANSDREERRVSWINARGSFEEERRQFVDHRQKERNSVDRVIIRRESRQIREFRSSLEGKLRDTENSSPTERRARDEMRDKRIHIQGVRNLFDENRRLSHDGRMREADPVRNERINSQLNRQEVQRVRDERDRQNFRRDTVTKTLQNNEQRDSRVSRTMRIRDIRQESRQPRSRESIERSRNIRLERREVRRSIRYDDRELRAFDRRERDITVLPLLERSEGIQISRDFNRNVSMNTRNKENRIPRNLERDNNRFRSDVRFAENRDSSVLRYKTREPENISTWNWQYLVYTLQAVYLCGILAKALTNDESGKKTRSIPWWSGPSHSSVKID